MTDERPRNSATPALQARLHAIVLEADGIASFELRAANGTALPAFTAGSHIDVHIRPGCVRQYSLCNDPAERDRYVVAVQREEGGRGGSRAMHDELRVGQEVTISAPRNFFALANDARRHLLLAGGIGVTPMMAMAAELAANGQDFFMHYCTREPGKTAFRGRAEALAATGRAAIHHDGGDPARGLDVKALLREPQPGTHVYCCGPTGFMEAVRAASAHWPAGTVHFEYFAPPAAPGAETKPNTAFRVRLARSGAELEVPPDKSIADVLQENDVFLETSCREGYCGTCLTRYLAGEPEHRDSVLDEDDRREFMLVCCSRARSPVIELDL